MSKHTSWHVGGPADLFFDPRDVADLAVLRAPAAAGSPLLWIGLGSNLLVRDGGIRGAVVSTHGALGDLERLSATRIRAEAGVPCARIARQCVKWGLGPAEFFAGIPGTLGGALAMNAGRLGRGDLAARGRGRGDRSPAARAARARPPSTRSATAASSGRAEEWFVAAQLEFERKPGVERWRDRELLEKRRETAAHRRMELRLGVHQSAGRSRGASDREPRASRDFASAMPRYREKHANFIINHGAARAADIEALIEHVRRTVARGPPRRARHRGAHRGRGRREPARDACRRGASRAAAATSARWPCFWAAIPASARSRS